MHFPSNATVVIPDLHGRYDLLCSALNCIERERRESVTLVFTGDYIDRGPQSREIVEWLIRPYHIKRIMLKGNHDQLMADSVILASNRAAGTWVHNGGVHTMEQYSYQGQHIWDHAMFLGSLPMIYRDKHRIYAHACVTPDMDLDAPDRQTLLWGRYNVVTDKPHHSGLHIVHGHTIVDNPVFLDHRTNLDCGAYLTNRLAIGIFDDAIPGGPVFCHYITPLSYSVCTVRNARV